MGYNLCITRKDEWFDEHGEEIELEEWLAVIDADEELKPDAENIATDPSVAIWLAQGGTPRMWFWMSEGDIVGKNPNPEALAKMHEISVALGARLMGEECEHYDAAGNASQPDFPADDAQKAEAMPRPWWKFW